jgi:NADPH:quinone reductase
VEIGKAMGARIIAGASTAEKLAVAQGRGADAIVNYTTESLTERVMALTDGKGADVCFDPVGGQLADGALSCLGWGGRMLLLGFVGGVQQIPANRLLVKNRSALGCSLGYFRRYGRGRLKPYIAHRLPLERSVEAIRLLTERKALGKIVVVPAGIEQWRIYFPGKHSRTMSAIGPKRT